MLKLKFFKCPHCGNVVVKLLDKNVPLFCCGVNMEELNANTTDASTEKHVPVVNKNGEFLEVKIGSVLHPMEDVHYINFVAVLMNDGNFVVHSFKPSDTPTLKIYLENKKPIAVYEYCNLQGLWKSEIK